MRTIQNFQINHIDVSEEEFTRKKEGNRLKQPGTYILTIIDVECTGPCKNDSTWYNYKLTLESEDKRTINHWVQIPTESIRYNPNGGGKNDLFVFFNLQDFIAGLGETLTPKVDSLNSILQKFFSNVENLKSKKIEVEIGFSSPYIAEVEGGKFVPTSTSNIPLKNFKEAFTSYDAAEVAMREAGFKYIDKFVSVTSFLPTKQQQTNVGF